MTNAQIEAIYKANIDKSRMTALRAIYNAGYYSGANTTVTASSPDQSFTASAPAVQINQKHCND